MLVHSLVNRVQLAFSLKHDRLQPLNPERRLLIEVDELTDVKLADTGSQTVVLGTLGEVHELGPLLTNGVIVVRAEAADGELK